MTLGEVVRKRREEAGLSQAALAEICHVDHSTIAKIEAGSRLPSVVLASRIAHAVDMNPDDLTNLLIRKREHERALVDKKRALLNSPLSADELDELLKAIRERSGR